MHVPNLRFGRALGGLAAGFVVVTAVASGVLSLTWPVSPVDVNVRWKADVTDARRADLERQFQLSHGEHSEGTTCAISSPMHRRRTSRR